MFQYGVKLTIVATTFAIMSNAVSRGADPVKILNNSAFDTIKNATKTRPIWQLGRVALEPVNAFNLNAKVLQYAESKLGQQIDRGECWDLANRALEFARAHQPGQNGYPVYVYGSAVALSSLKPGDILQFENVTFKHTTGTSWSTQNFPHHTAIVRRVQGQQIDLLQQNVNGNRTVQPGSINLADKQPGGTLVGYRPQSR